MNRYLSALLLSLCVMGGCVGEGLARPVSPARTQAPTCPLIFPEGEVVVAPNQPAVETASTKGIINALCAVRLNIVNLNFIPTEIILSCDSNGDGVDDRTTALTNLEVVTPQHVRATLNPLAPALPGTAFPIACCGGLMNLTMSRRDEAGQTLTSQTCAIEVGLRAPTVVSVAPLVGSFHVEQNLLLTGSCFLLPDGRPNVTSVFAVENGNPNNVIQAKSFVILNNNIIDTNFDFRGQNPPKRFLIFVSGVTGTNRNLSERPAAAQTDCPLGNEQGVQVTFSHFVEFFCTPDSPINGMCPCRPSDPRKGCQPIISSCALKRNASGVFVLTLRVTGVERGSTLTINGQPPKKLAFKNPESTSGLFHKVIVKGDLCAQLPGTIIVKTPGGEAYAAFDCRATCSTP